MGALVFFPWLRIEKDLSLGSVELIQYTRGINSPSILPEEQSDIDVITEIYRFNRETPISAATILKRSGRGILDDVSEGELEDLFTLAEIIAFSGLAGRRFFEPDRYCNRDQFRLVVHRFAAPATGVAMMHRRRDGSSTVFHTRMQVQTTIPPHVTESHEAIRLDIDLLNTLIKCVAQATHTPVRDAIIAFNAANTDNMEMLPEAELVLTNGAFERLFYSSSGKQRDICMPFLDMVKPRKDLFLADCQRISESRGAQRFRQTTTLREIWIRDLFNTRGDLAHGRFSMAYPSAWTIREHLLLSAFIFPLCVKLHFHKLREYSLTMDDLGDIEAFEALVCMDHFDTSEVWEAEYPWRKIISDTRLGGAIQRYLDEQDASS